ARVGHRDLADGAQLGDVQDTAVDAYPQHEVLVVEFVGFKHRGLAAVDSGPTLRVQAPPAHTAAQVLPVDRVEAAVRVDVLDPGPHVQAVVVLLDLLVRVQRSEMALGPLASPRCRLTWWER